jgi:hypothetical protein
VQEQQEQAQLKHTEQQQKEEHDSKLKLWQQKHQSKLAQINSVTIQSQKSSPGKPQKKACGHNCDLYVNRKCCACTGEIKFTY